MRSEGSRAREDHQPPSAQPAREIIVPHELADFDAFASAVAAQKLYPDAVIVLGRRVSPGLRDYLALHRDRFQTARFHQIDQAAVQRLIVVDARRRSRLNAFDTLRARLEAGDPSLDVHIYDHHPAQGEDDLVGSLEVVEPVGSATTLLVERIKQGELPIDVEEATLFALGIYADTGSLTFPNTSGRDARAVGWLLDQGGSLKTVNRYLKPAYSTEQRDLITALLNGIEVLNFGGCEVGFGTVELDKSVTGLAEVTNAVSGFHGNAALFAIFDVKGKQVQIVARSNTRLVDVAERLGAYAGGGHPSAAAAAVKGGDAAAIRQELAASFYRDPPNPRRVQDVMSTPVRSVAPDTRLVELKHSLRTWRHTGVPVVREGKLVGIVSRRDVEKAEAGNRLHLPVSSCMSQHVHTTTPEASLDSALKEMERRNVGRLPVLREGTLVGILSRTDVRSVLYGPMSIRSRG